MSILLNKSTNSSNFRDMPMDIFIEKSLDIGLKTLADIQTNIISNPKEFKELELVITKCLYFTLQDATSDLRLKRLIEILHDFIPFFLPNELRRAFRVKSIANLYQDFFDISISEQNQKVRFFTKLNKPLSEVKKVELWSDTRRDASNLGNYWVERFFDSICIDDLDTEIYTKTGRRYHESMNPLREKMQNTDSLYIMISCVAMILVGGKEEDPLSPTLAIAKIYHEYLYYLNSIVDNKHGVDSNNNNYISKVKDYTLASNLVFSHLKKYLKELNQVTLLNRDQYNYIDDLLDELNPKMMMIFFKDINSDITEYFDKQYSADEKQSILEDWCNHAVEMTASWTEFFALMGAISANTKYKDVCSQETVTAFGKLWGYGQLINGFKDFLVPSAAADDIREKRCTPQTLHLLFNAIDTKDIAWIKKTVLSSSLEKRDLTGVEKSQFVDLFTKYNTFGFIHAKVDFAINQFWNTYDNDQLLQKFLQENNIDLKMRNMIEGGVQSFFKESRYLGKS
jgi:hypothetical protein